MPEQDNKIFSSSGMDTRVIKPTVIGEVVSEKPLQPTVIGEIQPTVIGKVVSEKPFQPTVIGEIQPTVIGEVVSEKPLQPTLVQTSLQEHQNTKFHPNSPSVVVGKVREKIQVDMGSLQDFFPGETQNRLEKVLDVLKDIYIESLTPVFCSEWGKNSQQKYQKIVNNSLEITSSPDMNDAVKYMQRLYEILGEIMETFNEGNKLLTFFSKGNTPWEKYQNYRNEIQTLVTHFEKLLPTLRLNQEKIDEISRAADCIADEMYVYGISALYISEKYIESGTFSHHLATQGTSLLKLVKSIHDGNVLRSNYSNELDSLADRIQEGVLTTLPSCIEQFSLLTKKLTPTDSFTLKNKLESVMNQLK